MVSTYLSVGEKPWASINLQQYTTSITPVSQRSRSVGVQPEKNSRAILPKPHNTEAIKMMINTANLRVEISSVAIEEMGAGDSAAVGRKALGSQLTGAVVSSEKMNESMMCIICDRQFSTNFQLKQHTKRGKCIPKKARGEHVQPPKSMAISNMPSSAATDDNAHRTNEDNNLTNEGPVQEILPDIEGLDCNKTAVSSIENNASINKRKYDETVISDDEANYNDYPETPSPIPEEENAEPVSQPEGVRAKRKCVSRVGAGKYMSQDETDVTDSEKDGVWDVRDAAQVTDDSEEDINGFKAENRRRSSCTANTPRRNVSSDPPSSNIKIKKLPCDLCNRSFFNQLSLTHHKQLKQCERLKTFVESNDNDANMTALRSCKGWFSKCYLIF